MMFDQFKHCCLRLSLILLLFLASPLVLSDCGIPTWDSSDVPSYVDPSQTSIRNEVVNGNTALSYADYGTEHGYTAQHGGWGRVSVSLVAYQDKDAAKSRYDRYIANYSTDKYSQTTIDDQTMMFEGYWDSFGKQAGIALIYELRQENVILTVASDLHGTNLAVTSISSTLTQYLNDARSLLDGKCGPSIVIEPDPKSGLNFQKNIVKGDGFSILAQDSKGYLNLDWSTFQIKIADVDKTEHFVSTAMSLTKPMEQAVTDNSMRFTLYPDPLEFTTVENLFNLQFNGTWAVTVSICNRDGQCGSTDYNIYFGPFLDVRTVSDERCTTNSNKLSLRDVIIGNNGMPARGGLYLGVRRQDQSQAIITYQPASSSSYYEWRENVESAIEMDFASGMYLEYGPRDGNLRIDVISGSSGEVYLEDTALTHNPDLTHELLFTAIEIGLSQFHLGTLNVQLCPSSQ